MRWALLAAALLVILLLWTRVGVWAAFDAGGVRLDVKVGLLRLHILPGRPKKPEGAEKPKKEKKPKKPKPQPPEGEGPSLRPIAWEDIRDALHTVLPALGRALRRIGRGVRIKPLRLSLVLGGLEDPAAAAQLYGELHAAVWGGMPHLEALVDVRDPYIRVDVDYLSPSAVVEGEAGVTFRIGTLLCVGFGVAVPGLKWFLRWRKRRKAQGKMEPEETKKSAA